MIEELRKEIDKFSMVELAEIFEVSHGDILDYLREDDFEKIHYVYSRLHEWGHFEKKNRQAGLK